MRISVLLLFLLAPCRLAAQEIDTFFIRGANSEPIISHLRYLSDSGGLHNAAWAQLQFQKGQFRSAGTGRVFNHRYTRTTCWFALCLRNDTTVALPLAWSFYNNNILIDLFDATGSSPPVLAAQLSFRHPLSERPFPTRALTYRLDLAPGAVRLFLFRVTLADCDALYFPTDITTTEDLLLWETHYELLAGAYLGYFVFAFLINMCLWGIMRRRIHLWHACSIFMLLAYSLSENMLDVMLLPDWLYGAFVRLPRVLYLCASLIFSITVFQIFTRQETAMPRFYKFANFVRILTLVGVLALFAGSLLLPPRAFVMTVLRITCDALFMVGFGTLVISLFAGVVLRLKLFAWYLVAVSAVLLAYVDYISVNEFGVQLFYFMPGNILIGLSIEIFVLTVFFVSKQQQERRVAAQQQREAELRRASAAVEMVSALQAERQRIARDLHDGMGASLSSLRFYIRNHFKQKPGIEAGEAAFQSAIATQVEAISDETRRIAHNLMPADFENTGLAELLRRHIAILNETTPIRFSITLPQDLPAIAPEKEFGLYRVFLELLENVVRHSGAQTAHLCFENVAGQHLRCLLVDDGKGFAPDGPSGIGLQSVRSRVAYLRGTLKLQSSKTGTRIEIQLPIGETDTIF